MALTMVDIVQINKALSQNIDYTYIDDFYTFNKKSTASLEDVLLYLVKSLIKALENNDTTSKKINKLIHYTQVFTLQCFEADKCVDPELFLKLQSVIDAYNEYQGNKEEIKEKMDEFIKLLNEKSPLENGENLKVLQQLKEDKDNLLKRVSELEDTIKALNKEVNRLTNINEKSKNELKKGKDIRNNNKELLKQIESLKETISLLEQEILNLKKQISNLETIQEAKDEKYEIEIERLKKEIAITLKSIKDYKDIIEGYAKERKAIEDEKIEIQKQEQKEEFICEIIMNAILSSKYSLKGLRKALASLKIEVTNEELNYYLNLVRSKFSIKPSFSHGTAYYEINSALNTGEVLNIDMNNNPELDFLVLSNMYLRFTDNQRKDIELLYEYCKSNQINYIINLGNLFNFSLDKTPTVEDIKKFEELLSNIVYKYPTDPSIYNLFLGGTTEESILSLGLNPVDLLAAHRSDFISLGYVNSTITLGSDSLRNYILLHASEYDESTITLPNPNSLNSPYINLISSNKSKVDIALNSATISSFNSDSLVRAYHMKVIFDPNKKINKIIFMPLIIDKKIMHTASIHYTKFKNKKD